ncbi:hypothetical protein CLIB1444_08S00672 [[Candida] jaroonii]|uniref:Uncharacterized protein n=1 Tax=[Candida] jaroonii TaxID=467808 RepID=A0ACA9YB04_9ASCO|nr:hypothetical protein CLIB1444_08S00672 [[Candida] jaroonii]
MTDFEIIKSLTLEVNHHTNLHISISQLIHNFLKYLKEPRYQNPLTIEEISHLFQCFYKDLNSLITYVFTQSNSTKKQLISNCQYFKENSQKFDYLLAISNYSSSSIKLVKRTDDEALNQLRIFNFYKFLIIHKSMELSAFKLFNSVNDKDDDSLFEKLFKFNEKDLLIQDLLDKKMSLLKSFKIPLKNFLDTDIKEFDKLANILKDDDSESSEIEPNSEEIAIKLELNQLIDNLNKISETNIPSHKLQIVADFQKRLTKILTQVLKCDINNDILLPILIYIVIYKVDNSNFFLNFNFIKNFNNSLSPYEIHLSNNSNYVPPNDNRLKIKKTTLYDCLNLDESTESNQSNDFFNTDKDLIDYINGKYLNNSELHYYLTNFEAVLFFIQSVIINELMDVDTDEEILIKPISEIVEKQLFQFPKTSSDESLHLSNKNSNNSLNNRSRSNSLFNTLTNKFSEATKNRSRSNSNLKNTRESFPSVDIDNNPPTVPLIESDSFSMMKNIINRFGSVSVSQFKNFNEDEEQGLESTKHNRSQSLAERLSPTNSRTRSSSLENSTVSPARKNTIASKLSSGVTEIMTKFNTPVVPVNGTHSYNNSTTSLKSLEEETKRPEYVRSRTTSMQVMEKWFNNLSQQSQSQVQSTIRSNSTVDPIHGSIDGSITEVVPIVPVQVTAKEANDSIDESSVFSSPSKELMKYHNIEFDELTISDLRHLKTYYDQLCNELSLKFESKSTDLNDQFSSVNSI